MAKKTNVEDNAMAKKTNIEDNALVKKTNIEDNTLVKKTNVEGNTIVKELKKSKKPKKRRKSKNLLNIFTWFGKGVKGMEEAHKKGEKQMNEMDSKFKGTLLFAGHIFFWACWPLFAISTSKYYKYIREKPPSSVDNTVIDSVDKIVIDSVDKIVLGSVDNSVINSADNISIDVVKDTIFSWFPLTVMILSGLILILFSLIRWFYCHKKYNSLESSSNKDNPSSNKDNPSNNKNKPSNNKNNPYSTLAEDWSFICFITAAFILIVFGSTFLLEPIVKGYGSGFNYFTSLRRDEYQDWYIAIVLVSMFVLSLIMLARVRWWAATFFIGVAVSLFILIAPRILGDADGVEDWLRNNYLLISTISMASGIALPFILMGTDKKIPDWSARTNVKICQKAAVRALVVPGLIFTFISSSEIISVNAPTYLPVNAPTNSTNGEQTYNHDFTNNAIVLDDKSININYEEIIQ